MSTVRVYRLEDDLMKKTIPRQGSKRYERLRAAGGYGVNICEKCGRLLFNPQSILIHQGTKCKKQ